MTRTKAYVTLDNPTVTDHRRKARFWTVDRLWRMSEMLEQGRSDAHIARHFGVSPQAVNLARKRHSVRSRTQQILTARAVARMLGVSCAKTVVRWIEDKHLRGRRGQVRGLYRQWYVQPEALTAFLENPDTHHLWNPDRIPEHGLRRWATERWTGPFLTPGQVAERCYVTHRAVNAWIHRGTIPARKHGNWWIREADLVDFVPPNQRIKRGITPIRYMADEDTLLLDLRSDGWSWPRIARQMNRTVGSVYGRYTRLEAAS